jgi:hypothetical protein
MALTETHKAYNFSVTVIRNFMVTGTNGKTILQGEVWIDSDKKETRPIFF